jgi:hypothetical protein
MSLPQIGRCVTLRDGLAKEVDRLERKAAPREKEELNDLPRLAYGLSAAFVYAVAVSKLSFIFNFFDEPRRIVPSGKLTRCTLPAFTRRD